MQNTKSPSVDNRNPNPFTSRRDFMTFVAAVATGSLYVIAPAGQGLAQPVKKGKPNKELLDKMAKVRERLKSDTAFREKFQKDPAAALGEFKISRELAVNMMANDRGVKVSESWCLCTKCCCTSCSISKFRENDKLSLPASRNQKAWESL